MQTTQAPARGTTSAQARDKLGNIKLKSGLDKVHDICVAAQRNGVDDLSRQEIKHQWERLYGGHVDSGWISARVAGLLDANRLERLEYTRPCKVTGSDIQPVRVPMTQTRLDGVARGEY